MVSSRVVSSTQTWPGAAAVCTRAAVLTASPATMPCCSAPIVTATSPVTMPTRMARSGTLQVGAERLDPVDELQPGPHGPLRVVLVGGRDTPHRHHRVADELLHDAAVARHDPAALLEVARQELAHLLLVAGLREAREPDQVTEQHAGDPP